MATVSKRKWTHKGVEKEAWVVRYRHSGAHRSKQFDRKKDAEAFKQEVEREIHSDKHIPASEAKTVRQLGEDYLRWQEGRLRDGRIGVSRANLIRLAFDISILPHLGEERAKDITPNVVEDWYNKMLKTPRVSRCIHKTEEERVAANPSARHRPPLSKKKYALSPVTAKERVKELGYLFHWAAKRGLVKTNPVAPVLSDLKSVHRTRIKTPSIDDVAAILEAVERKPKFGRYRVQAYLRCAVHLAAFCGLRWGEIMGLTVDNVDLDARVIYVRHSLTQWDLLKAPKSNAGVRTIFLPEHLRNYLAVWLSEHYAENDRRLVFRGETGQKISPGTFHKSFWWPLLLRAGLGDADDRLHFHALRHFAVSAAIHSGMPLTDVPTFIGHRDLNTTLGIYTHSVANPNQALIANRMVEMIMPPVQ